MNKLEKLRFFNVAFIQSNVFKVRSPYHFHKQLLYVSQIHTTSSTRFDSTKTEKNILVYEAPLKKKMKIVKILSLTSSMVGFGFFPTVIYDLSKVSVFLGIGTGLISAFFLSTPLMLHYITKRYVLELYFNKETKVFTAKTYNIVCQIAETTFTAEDVEVPELPGMLSSLLAKGKPLFVDANMILDVDAYSHLMGYDKPFDIAIKVDEQEKNIKENST